MYQNDKDGVPFSALIPQFKTETALIKGDITRGNSIFSATSCQHCRHLCELSSCDITLIFGLHF